MCGFSVHCTILISDTIYKYRGQFSYKQDEKKKCFLKFQNIVVSLMGFKNHNQSQKHLLAGPYYIFVVLSFSIRKQVPEHWWWEGNAAGRTGCSGAEDSILLQEGNGQ